MHTPCSSALHKLKKTTITIEQCIQQDCLKAGEIILDYVHNIASFEIPLQIMVDQGLSHTFIMLSRARVKLVIVQMHTQNKSHIEGLKKIYPTSRFFETWQLTWESDNLQEKVNIPHMGLISYMNVDHLCWWSKNQMFC